MTRDKLLLDVGLCLTLCWVPTHAGQAGLAEDLSKGGTVLLLGDSIFDLH